MTFISTWDSNQPGARWDTGLQWDVNVGPSPGDVTPFLDLVTSEHRDQPDYISTLTFLIKPLVDTTYVINSMTVKYDLDVAEGAQLDAVGLWVGASRTLQAPLTDIYFSFDVVGLGFDEGTWQGPFNPNTYLINLSDAQFRLLIRARIMNDRWDGTVPGAYAIWDTLFEGTGYGLLIQNLSNMHMLFALTGPTPDAITRALYKGGYLNVRPVGVKVDAYLTPSVPDTPYFGFDVNSAVIAGFDTGAWGTA